MYASHFFSSKVLNTFNNVTAVGATQLFCALFLNSPGKSGVLGNELNYSGYTRKPITFTDPYVDQANPGVLNVISSSDLEWEPAPSDSGTVTHIGIFDSAVPGSGNMWLFSELAVSLPIQANREPGISAGDILYTSTGNFSIAFQTKILNLLRGQNIAGFTPYLSLYDGNPEGSGAELSGSAYARQQMMFSAPEVQAGGQTRIITTAGIVFPKPTATWGNWAYDAIRDAPTGGNNVVIMQNPSPEILQTNYVPEMNVGGYRVAMT